MKIYKHPNPILAKKWYNFLAIKYWPMWLALGLLRLSTYLPYRGMLGLGKILGYLFMWILPKKRRITATNLRLCFPHLSETARDKLLHESFTSAGIGLLETALAWWASDKRLRKQAHIEGTEFLAAAIAQNNGVMLMTAHFTSIELGIRLLSFAGPVCVMYRPQNNQLFEWVLQRARRHYVVEGITRYDAAGMLRCLRAGHAICYTPDQDYGRISSVFAPFFGVQAASVTGTSRFLKRTKSPLLPGFYYRDSKTQTYYLQIYPALNDFPSDDEVADATRINQLIEQAIMKHPEQYMWQHRRFKTRPIGEPYPYE